MKIRLIMKAVLLCLPLLVLMSPTNAADGPIYVDHSLMQVGPFSAEEFKEFLGGGFDVVEVTPEGLIKVVATPRDRDRLMTDFAAKVEIENIEAYNRSRLDPTRDMGGYHTISDMEVELWIMTIGYSHIIHVDTIGYSLEGRAILGVKISDNVETDEDEPEVYFNSLIHAREPMGLEITLDLMHQLLDNYGTDPAITAMVDETEIWITPIVNPDGYAFNEANEPFGGGMWRKNTRDNGDGTYGVDLNRNWGYMWGFDDYGSSPDGWSETFRGTGPFSEPETQTLRDFINAHDFPVIVNYHSHGDMYLHVWGFHRYALCPDTIRYAPLLDSLHSINYYEIYPDLYGTNGESCDWQYGEQFEKRKVFAVLPEVGYWFWPDAMDIDWIVGQNRPANFFFIREAQRLWDRPTRSLSTDFPAYFDSTSNCDEDYSFSPEFTNVHETVTYDIAVDHVNLMMPNEDWFNVTAFSTTLSPGASFSVPLEFSPQSLLGSPNGNVSQGRLRIIISTQDMPPVADTLMYDVVLFLDMTDTDEDGIADECDSCPLDPDDDIDMDGLCANEDNCPGAYNPLQEDFDSDTHGDSCDNCLIVFNPDQADTNGNDIGDVCDYICGDANGDEALNVGDAVSLINYVFKGGPAPEPLEAGLTNGDEVINVGDAVYMINFVFKGGDDPICPY
ncbi:MAG: hypothetical protein GY841_19910 [FCB group bacterium]|nr:hypothetical protein [FCB group bacterium]